MSGCGRRWWGPGAGGSCCTPGSVPSFFGRPTSQAQPREGPVGARVALSAFLPFSGRKDAQRTSRGLCRVPPGDRPRGHCLGLAGWGSGATASSPSRRGFGATTAQGEGSPRPQGARRGLGSGSRKPLTPDFFSFLREKKKKRFETEREELGEQTRVFVLT